MVLKEQGTKEREGSKNAMKQKEKYFFDKNEVIGNKKRAIKPLMSCLKHTLKKHLKTAQQKTIPLSKK